MTKNADSVPAPSLIRTIHTRFEANNAEYKLIEAVCPDDDDFAERGKIDVALRASQEEENALRHAILTQVPDDGDDALVLMFHIRLEQDAQANSAAPRSDAAGAILCIAIDTLFDFLACETKVDHEALGPRLQDACNAAFDARRYRTGVMEGC